MGDRLQLAFEESSKNMQLPIKAEHAKYGNIEGKNPKNKCIVVLTSGAIQIREENKSVKLKANYIWYDLIKMSINVPLIQLTFRQREKSVKKENSESDSETLVIEVIDNKVRSSNSKNQKDCYPNFQSFIESFSDILQRVLTPLELKKISFYSSIITEKVKPTYVSIMSRLSMILPLQNHPINPMSVETFKSMIYSHQKVFNLSTFKDSEYIIPTLFELFPLINDLEVLKIPEINNFQVYKASSAFLFQSNNLRYIEITGPKDDGFNEFLQKLQKSNLKTISYAFSNFSAQDLDLISSTILNSNIRCIEFHNAVIDSDRSNFYNNFLNPKMNSHLWSVNLNNTSNLNLPLLLQKLINISSLSLAYCGIEINSTIRLIHESKMNYLKYLNLSGNLCNDTLDTSVKLPNNLTHIMVNDVSWNDKSLTSFISLVLQLTRNEKNQKIKNNPVNPSKKRKDLYLSISHAITLQHEWSRLFQLLRINFSTSKNESFMQLRNSSHSSYNFSELRNAIANDDDDEERFYSVALRSLAWDENPVDTAFFDFLRESKELETLSLNSCFHETLESSLALFVDFIKSNDSLKNLFVAGSKKVHLGKKVIKVIEACLNKKNLKVLDLSISKCDSECLREFLPLFDDRKSSLDVVILDGVFPSDSTKFVNFLNQIKLMNSKTKISFPNGDCLNLKKQKKINQKQMDDINAIYKSLEGINDKNENEDEKDTNGNENKVQVPEFDEEKSSSSAKSNSSAKNVVKVKPLKQSEFIKQPYFYRYFYEPFIPYYIESEEVNEIRSNRFDTDSDEGNEVKINIEIDSDNKAVNNQQNEDDENDAFTLLPSDHDKDDEEEEEENGNKTFTLLLDDFKLNADDIDEEEEEEGEIEDDDQAIVNQSQKNKAVNKYFIDENEIEEYENSEDELINHNSSKQRSPNSNSSSKQRSPQPNTNYKQRNSNGSSKQSPNSYGSSRQSPNSYGSSKQSPNSYGSSKQSPNSYGSSKQSPNSYGSSRQSPLSSGGSKKARREENQVQNFEVSMKNTKQRSPQSNSRQSPHKNSLNEDNEDYDEDVHINIELKNSKQKSTPSKTNAKQSSRRAFPSESNEDNENETDNSQPKGRKSIKRRNPQAGRNRKPLRRQMKKNFRNENDEEDALESESKSSKRSARPRGRRLCKQTKKFTINQTEEETEIEISSSRKSAKSRNTQLSRSRKQSRQALRKTFPNQNNNENVKNEEETENEISSSRKSAKSRNTQLNRNKKQSRQAIRKTFPNQNNKKNENSGDDVVSEASSSTRKNAKQTRNSNSNRAKIIEVPKKVFYDMNSDVEDDNIKNTRPKSPQNKLKLTKKGQYNNEIENETDNNEEDLYSQQQLNNDSSSDSEDALEKTEVNDSFMNVTVGVKDLNNSDAFDTYETYEIVNQFTIPKQAQSSNLNKNISRNKNKNSIQSPNKSDQDKNRDRDINNKLIKNENNNDDGDNSEVYDYQLSPKVQNLINNFSKLYNLNNSEIVFQGFEQTFNNADIWTNMNDEFSIDKLFRNVKTIKEASP